LHFGYETHGRDHIPHDGMCICFTWAGSESGESGRRVAEHNAPGASRNPTGEGERAPEGRRGYELLSKTQRSCGATARVKIRYSFYDCILIDDTSRLTRKLADALNLYERLTFAGIRLVAVSQGVDSESSQAELLIGVHGLIDAVYWRELGQKTHRGMQGLALRGFRTGGRCFGYNSVKLEDSSARLEIDRAEAEIINRIYRLYAEAGYSMKRIAHTLNAEGVLAPQPQKGRFSRSWCVSSVRHILLNTRYTGKTTWNTRRKIRVPGTSKRVVRPRPHTEWVISETPHLRIVTDELATAVRRRPQTVKQMFGNFGGGLAAGPKRYLFLRSLKVRRLWRKHRTSLRARAAWRRSL
jgi:Recombinase/Resolvase, N terminal domain